MIDLEKILPCRGTGICTNDIHALDCPAHYRSALRAELQRERDAVLELVAKWREKAKIWGEHYVRTGVGQDRVMSRMFTERTDELEALLRPPEKTDV